MYFLVGNSYQQLSRNWRYFWSLLEFSRRQSWGKCFRWFSKFGFVLETHLLIHFALWFYFDNYFCLFVGRCIGFTKVIKHVNYYDDCDHIPSILSEALDESFYIEFLLIMPCFCECLYALKVITSLLWPNTFIRCSFHS